MAPGTVGVTAMLYLDDCDRVIFFIDPVLNAERAQVSRVAASQFAVQFSPDPAGII